MGFDPDLSSATINTKASWDLQMTGLLPPVPKASVVGWSTWPSFVDNIHPHDMKRGEPRWRSRKRIVAS